MIRFSTLNWVTLGKSINVTFCLVGILAGAQGDHPGGSEIICWLELFFSLYCFDVHWT